jgi:hypothetical protein
LPVGTEATSGGRFSATEHPRGSARESLTAEPSGGSAGAGASSGAREPRTTTGSGNSGVASSDASSSSDATGLRLLTSRYLFLVFAKR